MGNRAFYDGIRGRWSSKINIFIFKISKFPLSALVKFITPISCNLNCKDQKVHLTTFRHIYSDNGRKYSLIQNR